MGVKAIKSKYKIEHIVQKVGQNIHIGSPYINDIIVISHEGKIIKPYKDGSHINKNLQRYQDEMSVDEKSGELKSLVQVEDVYQDLILVYTYEGGRIVKKYCEVFGWPNLTTEGKIMYDNTFFRTYKEAYMALLSNTKLKYQWRSWKETMVENLSRIMKKTRYLLIDVCEFIYARTIQRIVGLFISVH